MKLKIIPIDTSNLLESFESQVIYPSKYCKVCLESTPEYLFPGIFTYDPETLEILGRGYIIQEKLKEYGNPETEIIFNESTEKGDVR